MDRNLVDGDKVVRSSYFSACCDGGRGCHSAVLRGDHHCDVVWWSRWSELGRAARDVVDVVWWSELEGAARDVVWWSKLGGAAQDMVDMVRGRLDMAHSVARRGSLLHRCGPLDGLNSLMWLACGSAWLAQRLVRLPCCLTMARPTWRRTHLVGVLMMS